MGNELFGVDIAGIVADALGDDVFDVTITREVHGDRDPDNLTAGRERAAPLNFDCKGFWEDFSNTPPGIALEVGDRKAVLIGDTIPPEALPILRNDKITVHEDMGDVSLYVERPVRRDPAAAVYEFQCRDRSGPDKV